MCAVMDRRSVLLSVTGMISSLAGIGAFVLPWHGDLTGVDLATGTLGDLPGSIQTYMPAVAAMLMAAILALSAVNLAYRREKVPAFGVIILGFVVLGVTMAFASWDPSGTKMMFDSGPGLYIMIVASCIYIFYGIAAFMVRGLPQSRSVPLSRTI